MAIGDAEAPAEIDEGDGEALAAQVGDQFMQQRERIAERREVGDLAADMHMHAGGFDAGQLARQRVKGRGLRERNAEFVLGLSRRDLVVSFGVDIRIDAEGDARGRARLAATSLNALSSGSDSTLKAKMPASSANSHLGLRLADARNTISLRRDLDRQRAAKLALRHDVHAGAEPAERGEHAEIRVRLDRIADERIGRAGEGIGEHPIVTLQRRRRVAIEGSSNGRSEVGKIDLLGVEHIWWETPRR